MRIYFTSDTHLEHFQYLQLCTDTIEPESILCLAGDICTLSQNRSIIKSHLIRWCSLFKYVVYIAGNHEYYSMGCEAMTEVDKELKSFETELGVSNLHVLNNETFVVPDTNIVIVGSTLWTHIPPEMDEDAITMMNDYVFIKVNDPGRHQSSTRAVRPEDIRKLHSASVKFIRKTINSYKGTDTQLVLMTHHKPLWHDVSNKFAPDDKYSWLYKSKTLELLLRRKDSPIKFCIFGHTHDPYDYTLRNGTRILSNPHGYPREGFLRENFSLDKYNIDL